MFLDGSKTLPLPKSAMLQSNSPQPRAPRYLSLDLWRGIACLLVVVHHSTMYAIRPEGPPSDLSSWILNATTWMWIGVPLFFVISGYCISAAADSARRRVHALRTYFTRRIRRIYPPFWALLLLSLAVVIFLQIAVVPPLFSDRLQVQYPWELSAKEWLGNLTLSESWLHHLVGGECKYFLEHTWTLCYEEQFYALMGILIVLPTRYFFPAAGVLTLIVLLVRHGAASLSVRYGAPVPLVDGTFLDGHWLQFAAGILVYYRVNYARSAWISNFLLALAILYAARHPTNLLDPLNTVDRRGFFAFCFALALSLIHRWDRSLASLRILRPFTLCGTMCYSLYLVHFPIVIIISQVFARKELSVRQRPSWSPYPFVRQRH